MLCLACCAALGRAVCTGGRGTAASCAAVARTAAAVDAAQQRCLTVKPASPSLSATPRLNRSTVSEGLSTDGPLDLTLGRPPRQQCKGEESPYRPVGLMLSAAGEERGSRAGRDVCDRSLLCNTASVCGMGASRNGPQWVLAVASSQPHPSRQGEAIFTRERSLEAEAALHYRIVFWACSSGFPVLRCHRSCVASSSY